MSELTQLEMTLDEARETDRLIKRHINTTRYLLLDMRDRKGWKALGYESFVEYGEKELGFASTHLYRLADSAEISLQIGFSPIGEKQPKETHLRPLTDVPESERKAIWEEATRKAEEEHAKLTAKLADVRVRYPDLAALVDDERITLTDAIASSESRDLEAQRKAERLAFEAAEKERIAQEEAARLQAEEDAKLAEEDRKAREAARLALKFCWEFSLGYL